MPPGEMFASMVYFARPRPHMWPSGLTGVVRIGVIIAVTVIMLTTHPHSGATTPALVEVRACSVAVPTPSRAVLPLDGPTTVAQTALSTNVQQADELAPVSLKQASLGMVLAQWQPPLARLHFGFNGDDFGSLPEATQGQWDFGHLDAAITQIRAIHQPFYLNVRSAPPWMFDGRGQLRDPTYQEFATYMARLVGWYNQGGFTDDNGLYHASGHQGWITTWEIWNEPNSGYEIPAPVSNPDATWMPAARFARLYDVTVAAMRAVDPTITTGGPTISSFPDNQYIATFLRDATQPIGFLSFHFYALASIKSPDAELFSQINGQRLLTRIITIKAIMQRERPGQHIPLWLDEVGFNENARLPIDPRGTSSVANAYVAALLTLFEGQGVAQLGQFAAVGSAQQGLVDYQDFHIYPIAQLYVALTRLFPPGMRLITAHGDAATGITTLAMLTPDHHHLHILLGNTRVQSLTDNNGAGVAQTLCLSLVGKHLAPVTTAQVWRFTGGHRASNRAPTPQRVTFTPQGTAQTDVALHLDGYSATIIDVTLP